MSHQVFAVVVLLLAGLFGVPQAVWAQQQQPVATSEPIRVTFVNPDSPDAPFWQRLIMVMSAAAKDLNIELNVVHANNVRMASVEALMAEIQSESPPDYLVYIYFRQATAYVLEAAEKAGVKSLIINTEIPQAERAAIGSPRGRFSQWIGHIYPDDQQAGAQLLSELLVLSAQKGNTKHHVTAISGALSSATALERDKGIKAAIAASAFDNLKLNQLVHANWNGDGVNDMMKGLMLRHPSTNVLWTASDLIALKAMDTINRLPQEQRRQFVVGGMNWSEQGLNAVAQGDMDISLGGHFMEGAWAMVLLHDYHHGHDFAEQGTRLVTQLFPVTKQNIQQVSSLLTSKQWQQVDFRSFSKVYQPQPSDYRFHWAAIVEQLNQPQ